MLRSLFGGNGRGADGGRAGAQPAAAPAPAVQPAAAGPVQGFLDPKVLARIGNLELLARTVVEGFLNGLHRSPHLGTSMDFAEHRAYMPGDDTRRIDWKLYARTDRYYVKEFEADTNTNFLVLLDISRSMSYGSRGITKLDYAKYAAACLAHFSSRQRDRVGLVTFDSDVVSYIPPSAKHLPMVLHEIDRVRPRGEGKLGPSLRKVSEAVRRRSMLLLLSDLYEDPKDVLTAVDHLRGRGNDLLVMQILDPAELEFPFDEAASFEDLETEEKIPVVPEQMKEQYKTAMGGHLASLARLLGDNDVDYALFDTSRPLDYALFEYLSKREALAGASSTRGAGRR